MSENKKIALITGASKGLGRHCSKRFWEAGFDLCLVSSNKSQLEFTAGDFEPRDGQRLHTFACDLSKKADIESLVFFIRKNISHVNVLINNAAIQGPIGPLWENEPALWEKTFRVNFYAPVFLIQAIIPLMKNRKNSSIINLSGGGATSARPNFSAYASAKAALVRFSETLAEEVREIGIRVNCIAPGAMNTDMLAEIVKNGEISAGEREFAIANKVFAEGGASMERVADLMLFLSGDSGSEITGKLISSVWDNWENWPNHLNELKSTDLYTLRRITARDRGFEWGDI